jgi:hypothetical protein
MRGSSPVASNISAALCVVVAGASILAVRAGALPRPSTFREREAVDFLFATAIPLLLLAVFFRIWRDPPSGYEPGLREKAINSTYMLPLMLTLLAVFALSILTGIGALLGIITGHQVHFLPLPWA